MEVHLVDGTYELFRQYYGQIHAGAVRQGRATAGVVSTLVSMLEDGVTHLAVATDHKVESFRNDLWPGYKSSAGVPEDLLSQFPLLEDVVASLGVLVLAMEELEADDALASAAATAEADRSVERVLIWSPDKDLGQCVRGKRVVQVERRSGLVIDADGVVAKFGVEPASIPDYLALVGDAADGFPGLSGWGKRSAAAVLSRYGHLEEIPDDVAEWDRELRSSVRSAPALATRLSSERELALLFRQIATLRVDPSLVKETAAMAWRGSEAGFAAIAESIGGERLSERVARLEARLG